MARWHPVVFQANSDMASYHKISILGQVYSSCSQNSFVPSPPTVNPCISDGQNTGRKTSLGVLKVQDWWNKNQPVLPSMCKKQCELGCIVPDYAVIKVNHVDLPGQESKPVEVRTPRLSFWTKWQTWTWIYKQQENLIIGQSSAFLVELQF